MKLLKLWRNPNPEVSLIDPDTRVRMMNELEILKENERIDDLEINGFRIIQNPFSFCFGMDSVLLSDFISIKPSSKVLDLGTGTGIIPLLLAAKGKGKDWTGLEIQPDMAEMAGRSVELNGIQDTCRIIQGDLRNIREMFKQGSFDAVTSNPPYMKEGSGLRNPEDSKYIARHEVTATLEDVVSAAAYLLKTRGSFNMVHRPSRLAEIIEMLCRYNLEPKRMRLVQPTAEKPANMVLIEAVKEAGQEMKVLPTIIVYGEDGEYTRDILEIYGKLNQ